MSDENQNNPADDVVDRYRRLLAMARNSLEANQTALAEKDQQIKQLMSAVDDLKSQNSIKFAAKKPSQKEDENSNSIPRRILCRVEVEDAIWLLIEYEDSNDDVWKSFTDEQLMVDFIQRIPGVPLICPPKCLSVEESTRIEEDSKRKVERIVEEFRRYKVRTEIAKKQKDAETKQANSNITLTSANNNTIQSTLPSSLEKALSQGYYLYQCYHRVIRLHNSSYSRIPDREVNMTQTRTLPVQ
eukprot:gene14998-20175_t